MPRGGKRPNAGRTKNKPEIAGHVDRKIATLVLELKERPKHDKECKCELCAGWYWLNETRDERVRWEARKWYTEKRDGKNVQTVNHLHDKPLEVNMTVSLAEAVQKARKRVGK